MHFSLSIIIIVTKHGLFVLSGDLNDKLIDLNFANVLKSFNIGIALSSSSNLSYSGSPSHIDHILITNKIVDEFQNSLTLQMILIKEL